MSYPAALVRVPLAILLTLVLQASLLSALGRGVVRPDAMLLLPIAAGIVAGAERGIIVGFFAGLVSDLFLQTPLGLSAITYSVVGFGVGTVQAGVLRATWWITPLSAMVASAVGVLMFAVVGTVVGQTHLIRPDLPTITIGVAVINAPLSVAIVRLMSWALPTEIRSFAR